MALSRHTIDEIKRFALVGAIGFSIDLAVYASLSNLWGLDESWAKRISFACISIWGFFANKHYTFRNQRFCPREPFKFAAVYLIGWVLNSFVHDSMIAIEQPVTIAFLLATFCWACWNFVGQKIFVFSSRKF